jgi:kynurenine formamidase
MNDRPLSLAEFEAIAERCAADAAAAAHDPRGTLRFVDPAATLRGIASVTEGVSIPCGSQATVDRADSAAPRVKLSFTDMSSWAVINDRLAMDVHGWQAGTHLDALGHVFYQGLGYGGASHEDFDEDGLRRHAVGALGSALVTRGILVDLPRYLGVEYLGPGHRCGLETVQSALAAEDVQCLPGDVLLIHTGAQGLREAFPDRDPSAGAPGLSIECADWVRRSKLAMIVTDCGLDPAPSEVTGVPVPWHLLLLARLGMPLIDNAHTAELALKCASVNRWSCLLTLGWLDVPGASGSPVNPVAVL